MIESISIANFQAHKRLKIDLDPAVTTLVGPSDVGKSSFIRATRWVCLNEASADFTTFGEKYSKVEIIAEGRSIVRKKGSGDNYYCLDNADPYDAVGKSVPEDVSDILNVTELNFQAQMDAPFWLSETPGEVSRQLNQIIDLSLIDDSLSNIASEIREANATAKMCRERLDAAKDKEESLRWTKEAMKDVALHSVLESATKEKRARIAELASIVRDVKLANDANRLAGAIAVDVSKCIEYAIRVNLAQQVANELKNLVSSVKKNREYRIPDEFIDLYEEINQLRIQIECNRKHWEELRSLVVGVKLEQKKAKTFKREADNITTEIESKPRCKTCGQTI